MSLRGVLLKEGRRSNLTDCLERCQFDAIETRKVEGSEQFKAVVDPRKCRGCGVCTLICEPRALRMHLVRPPEHIPT